jgi:hypothetical protein
MCPEGRSQDLVAPEAGSTVAAEPLDAPPAALPVVVAAEAVTAAHRPLREHGGPTAPTPTDPLAFAGYPSPPFGVVPRKPAIALFPCTQCHALLPKNATPRRLVSAPHVADLPHGGGRMWCLDCHDLDDRSRLVSVRGDAIDFDQSHLLCGQCHGNRHRDWWYGGHGKRASDWNAARVVWNCTHCHDAHAPTLAPRVPAPPPPVRAGLVRPHASAPTNQGADR